MRINYQSIGSGGGIRQITESTVDFGASDAPMKDEELAKAPGKLLAHPDHARRGRARATTSPGVPSGLQAHARGARRHLPGRDQEVERPEDRERQPRREAARRRRSRVAYRSDGSGTTAVFTDYLAAVSPAWKDKVGAGKSGEVPGRPRRQGQRGRRRPGQDHAGRHRLRRARLRQADRPRRTPSLQNAAGKFVEPSLEGITRRRRRRRGSMPDDMRVSIVERAPATPRYPISAFTYILVYEEQTDAAKGKALAEFLWWAIHDGQKLAPPLDYAPLPAEVVTKVEAKLQVHHGRRPAAARRSSGRRADDRPRATTAERRRREPQARARLPLRARSNLGDRIFRVVARDVRAPPVLALARDGRRR